MSRLTLPMCLLCVAYIAWCDKTDSVYVFLLIQFSVLLCTLITICCQTCISLTSTVCVHRMFVLFARLVYVILRVNVQILSDKNFAENVTESHRQS